MFISAIKSAYRTKVKLLAVKVLQNIDLIYLSSLFFLICLLVALPSSHIDLFSVLHIHTLRWRGDKQSVELLPSQSFHHTAGSFISYIINHIVENSLLSFKTFDGSTKPTKWSIYSSFSMWSQFYFLHWPYALLAFTSHNSLNTADTFMSSHLVAVCNVVIVLCLHMYPSYIYLIVYSIIQAQIKGHIFHLAHLVNRSKYL